MIHKLILICCGISFNLLALEALDPKIELNSKCTKVFGRSLDYYEKLIDEFPRWETLITKGLSKHSTSEIVGLLKEFIVKWNTNHEERIKIQPQALFLSFGEGTTILNELIDYYTIKIHEGEKVRQLLETALTIDDVYNIEQIILSYQDDLYYLLLLKEAKRRRR